MIYRNIKFFIEICEISMWFFALKIVIYWIKIIIYAP